MIEKFKIWLLEGREIEFNYKNDEYFIGNYDEGRAIFKGNEIKTKYYLNIEDFIEKATIDGNNLKNILNEKEFEIITIF